MMNRERLMGGLDALGIAYDQTAMERFEAFHAILDEYNQRMDLTAVLDEDERVDRHDLDSAAPLAQGLLAPDARVIDVGTGAGFPGMPMGILCRDASLTLLDSLGKRIDFLRDAAAALKLENISCVHARAEEFAAEHRENYDVSVSRAVAALPVLSELALPLVKTDGLFLAMKSVDSDDEIQSARSAMGQLGGKLESIRDYAIPGTEVTHRLVVIRKVKDTPPQFPRSWAKMKKAPLK